MKITVDIDIQEIVDESSYSEITFKEEFTSVLKSAVVDELKERCADAVLKQIQKPVFEQTKEIADGIAKEIIESDLKTRKFEFEINYNTKTATIGELIETCIDKWARGRIVEMVQKQAKDLVEELRKRYDMTFAAMIVDNMRKQKLLADDRIAELLAPPSKQ